MRLVWSKALLGCGILASITKSVRAHTGKGSKKGSSYPSGYPSSAPSSLPSQIPSPYPSSSPSEEGTRKFVFCQGDSDNNVTSTSTVDDVEEALEEVKASMRAARTAAVDTSEDFAAKVEKFQLVAWVLKEAGELLWTSSVATGANLVVDENKVTQSLITEELEGAFSESELILQETNIQYSNFRTINIDPILDEIAIRLSSIGNAYKVFIKASDSSKELALTKFR
jgi:hypothetical protein